MAAGFGRIPAIAFCASVLAAAVFAFSPRAIPVFPETGVRPDTLLLLGAARAGERIVAVGERGRVLLSDDDGWNWRAAKSPTEATLTAVRFVDGRHGWAVGHDAIVLRTDDAGETWRIVHAAPHEQRPLLDVHFGDPQRGIAVGAYGAFLETADGGRTWTPRAITRDDPHLNAIAVHGERLYIAGESGTLLTSSDGGRHWERISAPYQGSFFGLLGVVDAHLIAFGLRGNVFRAADPLAAWQRVENTGVSSLMGGTSYPPDNVVLAGQDGAVLLSRDGGASFALRRDPGGSAFSAVLPAADGSLLAFGERGILRIPGPHAP